MNYYRNKYKIGKILESSFGKTLGYGNDYSNYINSIFEYTDPKIEKCSDCEKIVIDKCKLCLVDTCNKTICCSTNCARCNKSRSVCLEHKNHFQQIYKEHFRNSRRVRVLYNLCLDCIIKAADRERREREERELRERQFNERMERSRLYHSRLRERQQRLTQDMIQDGAIYTQNGDLLWCRDCGSTITTENPVPYTYFCNRQCYNRFRMGRLHRS